MNIPFVCIVFDSISVFTAFRWMLGFCDIKILYRPVYILLFYFICMKTYFGTLFLPLYCIPLRWCLRSDSGNDLQNPGLVRLLCLSSRENGVKRYKRIFQGRTNECSSGSLESKPLDNHLGIFDLLLSDIYWIFSSSSTMLFLIDPIQSRFLNFASWYLLHSCVVSFIRILCLIDCMCY